MSGQSQYPLHFAEGPGPRGLAPLASDDHRRNPGYAPQTGDRRGVIAPGAVAMELDPLRGETAKVITGAWTLGMARQPCLLPAGNPGPRANRLAAGETGRPCRGTSQCRGPVL